MVRPMFFMVSALTMLWCPFLTSIFAEDDTSNTKIQDSVKSPDFQPGEISIGEPLQVPFQKPKAVVPPPAVPTKPSDAKPPAVPSKSSDSNELERSLNKDTNDAFKEEIKSGEKSPEDTSRPGTGWLGVTVDDSIVPGRLVVVDVASGGPAAVAGVTPQDILLGINGSPLKTSDEMAAVLATIVPGVTVKIAIGKGEVVKDLELIATKRPQKTLQEKTDAILPAESLASNYKSNTPSQSPTVQVPSMAQSPAVMAPNPPSSASVAKAPVSTSSTPAAGMLPTPVPAPVPMNATNSPPGRIALGVRTVPVDSVVQARYRLPVASGAYVIGVVANLPASMAGIPPGSVIVAIRNQPVRNPSDLTRLVTSGPLGAPVPLKYVLPGGESRHADVMLQSIEAPLERALVGEIAKEPLNGFREAERIITLPATKNSLSNDAITIAREDIRDLYRQIEQLEQRIEQLESTNLR